MRNPFIGCPIAWAITGLLVLFSGAAAAESRVSDDAAGWVPAISAFSGLVSASSAEPTAASDWAEPEQPLAVGDTVEIIQVILVPESVAVAAGASDAAARFVIEKRAATGSDGGQRWVLTEAEPRGAGTQRTDGAPPKGALPTQSADGEREILVEAPAPFADSAAAPAEPVVKDETERWVPSVAIFSGVIAADLTAEVASSRMDRRNFFKPDPGTKDNPRPQDTPDFLEDECTTLPSDLGEFDCTEELPSEFLGELVRPAAFGDDLGVEPFIGGQIELMTPGLQKVPGRPRFYVAGDVTKSFGFNRDVAKETDPGEMLIKGELNEIEESVKGQGSRATVEPWNLVVGANAGMAFTIDIGERRLRIKPNAGYLRQKVGYTGSVNRALLINTGAFRPGDPPVDIKPTWETIKIEGTEREVYHALGPGLELEFDTARVGPFMLSLFATGNAYKIISGVRKIEFEGEATWENYIPEEQGGGTETRTETAVWKFEKDPWSYRGAVGLRFRWLPE